MAKQKKLTKAERTKKLRIKKLLSELNELFLRDGAGLEMGERGLYHRALANITMLGGSVDKNTVQLARIREVIEELGRAI